jgi:WD40 repeat protein
MLMAKFSPDSKSFITVSEDDIINVWRTSDGMFLRKLDAHAGRPESVEFSFDGKMLVSSYDDLAIVWDVNTGASLNEISYGLSCTSAKFNANATKLVMAFAEKSAWVWDLQLKQYTIGLEGHTSEIIAEQFSPDGRAIATANGDGFARIWDTDTGELLKVLKGHKSMVMSVQYSADGRSVLTGSDDSTAKLWNVFTGKPLVTFRGHKGSVNYAGFSSDGTKVITAADDSIAESMDH